VAVSVMGLGAVISPLSPAYQRAEIAYQLNTSKATVCIAHPTCIEHVLEAQKDAPGVKHVIVLDGDDDHLIPAGLPRLSNLVKGRHHLTEPTPCEGNDLAALPFSSGTTGLPKVRRGSLFSFFKSRAVSLTFSSFLNEYVM